MSMVIQNLTNVNNAAEEVVKVNKVGKQDINPVRGTHLVNQFILLDILLHRFRGLRDLKRRRNNQRPVS